MACPKQKAGTKCGGKGIPETASSDRSRRKEMFGVDRYLGFLTY